MSDTYADMEDRLALCRQVVGQVQAEREGLERLLLRLPSLCVELDPVALRRGVLEAAVEMAQARVGFFVPTDPAHRLTDLVAWRPASSPSRPSRATHRFWPPSSTTGGCYA